MQHDACCSTFCPCGSGGRIRFRVQGLRLGVITHSLEDLAGSCIGNDTDCRTDGRATKPRGDQSRRDIGHHFLVAAELPTLGFRISQISSTGGISSTRRACVCLFLRRLPKLLGLIGLRPAYRTDHPTGQLRRALDQVNTLLHGLFIRPVKFLIGIGGVTVQPH